MASGVPAQWNGRINRVRNSASKSDPEVLPTAIGTSSITAVMLDVPHFALIATESRMDDEVQVRNEMEAERLSVTNKSTAVDLFVTWWRRGCLAMGA